MRQPQRPENGLARRRASHLKNGGGQNARATGGPGILPVTNSD
jgi:hypothetical protein